MENKTERRMKETRTPERAGRFRSMRFRLVSLGVLLLAGVGVGVLVVVVYAMTLVPDLPTLRGTKNPEVSLASYVYSADGREIARFYRENRTWVGYHDISPHVIKALIATEDHRFYDHWGIDVRRLFTSMVKTVGGDPQGGSTLTMQLSRNLYPDIGSAETVDRKIKEVMTAFKIERNYGKQEILEMYLNTVPFGYNSFGIQAAAETYFNKDASDLDLIESATLVGMLKGTTRYNPMRNPELARQRRDVVLAQMVRRQALDLAAYQQARSEPLRLDFHQRSMASSIAPHFAEYVREWMENWTEQYGYDLYADGLKVYTTLDSRLQTLAVAAVETQMDRLQAVADYEWSRSSGFTLGPNEEAYVRQRPARGFGYFWDTRTDLVDEYIRSTARYSRLRQNGKSAGDAIDALRRDVAFMDSLRVRKTRVETGLVSIDPHTGHVLAWVGGRDFESDQYDKVGLARRQPGSTFKPFVYTAAIDYGFAPDYTLKDTLTTIQLAGSSKTWTPRNAGGGYSGRDVTLRDGLVYSKNTITAQLTERLGAYQVAGYAHRMGIVSPLEKVPSIGLGTSEVTLLELTGAYTTLAAHGVRRTPVIVTRIEDRDGRLLAGIEPDGEKAVSMFTAYTVLDMLRDVVKRGTGSPSRWKYGITEDVAGKTGTTQNGADGWFVLLHPRLVTGAWVGFNDRRITFRSNYWGQGGHNALNVVGEYFRNVLADGRLIRRGETFTPPPGYREPQPLYETDAYDLYDEEPYQVTYEESYDAYRMRVDSSDRTSDRYQPRWMNTYESNAQAGSNEEVHLEELTERERDAEQALRKETAVHPAAPDPLPLEPLPEAAKAPAAIVPLELELPGDTTSTSR